MEVDKEVREAAELKVKEEVKEAGVAILHGDLLTDVRFETCKRLRRMAVTAVERFDFLVYFRLGTFHMGMNNIIQDVVAGIKSDVNVEDLLSMGYFKTTLGFHHITNSPDAIKRDGNFEYHSQFCEDIGVELLVEAFKEFTAKHEVDTEKTEEGAVQLILEFLKKTDIKYFYDPLNYEEASVHDDMMTSCKDNLARAVISLVLDSVEHEGDGMGLRAVRTVLIPYFLNRKENYQDSKYAPRLLFNRIWYLQASPRTQSRIDLMACCNPSGKPGHSNARDQQNEHKVKSTKVLLRGLHSQLGDLPVEKTVTGSNILELITGHDRQAMLVTEEGGKSSSRYISEVQKTKMRGEIRNNKPFSYEREKVDYYDKPRGVWSGLTAEQIDRFILRNKNNFRRNSPHKAFLPAQNNGADDNPEAMETETTVLGTDAVAVDGSDLDVEMTILDKGESERTGADFGGLHEPGGVEAGLEETNSEGMTVAGEHEPDHEETYLAEMMDAVAGSSRDVSSLAGSWGEDDASPEETEVMEDICLEERTGRPHNG